MDDPSRPLLLRFGAMGDLVLLQPLIEALSRRFEAPVDLVAGGGWTRPLLEGQPGVGRIHLLANRKLPALLNRSARTLDRALADAGRRPTWLCDTDDRSLPMLARAGIGPPDLVRPDPAPGGRVEHLLDTYARMAVRLPERLDRAPGPAIAPAAAPRLLITEDRQADLRRWLAARDLAHAPLLLVQPGNKRTMRGGWRRRPGNTKWWPEPRWAEVIRAMARRCPEAFVLLTGVPQEAGLNDEILALAAEPRAINVARDLPLPRLLALQQRAVGMVSVDTGPAHTAAALGCPLVVLFGIADPRRIAPRSLTAPVTVLIGIAADGSQSMPAISSQEVIQAWQALPLRPWSD